MGNPRNGNPLSGSLPHPCGHPHNGGASMRTWMILAVLLVLPQVASAEPAFLWGMTLDQIRSRYPNGEILIRKQPQEGRSAKSIVRVITVYAAVVAVDGLPPEYVNFTFGVDETLLIVTVSLTRNSAAQAIKDNERVPALRVMVTTPSFATAPEKPTDCTSWNQLGPRSERSTVRSGSGTLHEMALSSVAARQEHGPSLAGLPQRCRATSCPSSR
jgi:hypothetical protein